MRAASASVTTHTLIGPMRSDDERPERRGLVEPAEPVGVEQPQRLRQRPVNAHRGRRLTEAPFMNRRPRRDRARGSERGCAPRRVFERVEIGRRIGVREREFVGGVDRHDVQMRVRHLFADDEHADAPRLPFEILGPADLLRDPEQVRGERRVEIDPVIDLVAGTTSVCPGIIGAIDRNATARSSFQTNLPGSSPAMIRLKMLGTGSPFLWPFAWLLDAAGAVDRAHDERRRCQSGRRTVARRGACDDVVDPVRGDERHDASAEARAGEARAVRALVDRARRPARRAPVSTRGSRRGATRGSRSSARRTRSRSPARSVSTNSSTRAFSDTTWRANGSSATWASVASRSVSTPMRAAAASHAARRSA